jgi:hypothetical protein
MPDRQTSMPLRQTPMPIKANLFESHRLLEIGGAVDDLNYSYGCTPSPSTSYSSEITASLKKG